MEIEIAAELAMPESGAHENRRRLQRAGGDDDGTSVHAHGTSRAAAFVARRGVHAGDGAVLKTDAFCLARSDDRGATSLLRVTQERVRGGLLAPHAAAEHAEAALVLLASTRVSRNVGPRQLERDTSALQRRVVAVADAFVRTHVHSGAHGVERARECLVGECTNTRALGPLVADVVRRAQRRLPVDRGAAADAAAREDRDAEVATRRRALIQIQPLSADDLAMIEVGRLIRRTRFEHHHRAAGGRKLRRDDSTAGARSDDAGIGIQRRRLGDACDRERRGPRHASGQLVPDRSPGRVHPRVDRDGIKQKRRESLERLKAGANGRDRAVRQPEQRRFALVRMQGRQAMKAPRNQKHEQPRVEQPQKETQLAQLARAERRHGLFDRVSESDVAGAGPKQLRRLVRLRLERRQQRVTHRRERSALPLREQRRDRGGGGCGGCAHSDCDSAPGPCPSPSANMRTVLMFTNSRSPYALSSRPYPDALTPPNGKRGSDTTIPFTNTVPAWSSRAK